jgi:hypothetical protein
MDDTVRISGVAEDFVFRGASAARSCREDRDLPHRFVFPRPAIPVSVALERSSTGS